MEDVEGLVRSGRGRLRVAVLGAGLLGVDLIERMQDDDIRARMECVLVAGRNPHSAGLRRAGELGCSTSPDGVGAVVDLARGGDAPDLVFDTSDASTHVRLADGLASSGVVIIDLTPSHLGVPVVPVANAEDAVGVADVSLISCAGQAAIPVLHVLSCRFRPEYVEVVTTASSVTAGPATRRNLDEFVRTTRAAIARLTGADAVKVIANVSPARPRPPFRVVLRMIAQHVDADVAEEAVEMAALAVREFSPGYQVTSCRIETGLRDGDLITVVVKVVPSTNRLPGYAGNLEIINAAALAVADRLAAVLPVGSPS